MDSPQKSEASGVDQDALQAELDELRRFKAEHEQREDELRRGYEMLSKVQKNAGMGIWQWYPDTDDFYWSQTACDIHGTTPKIQAGLPVGFAHFTTGTAAANFIYPDDLQRYFRQFEAGLLAGELQPIQYRITRTDGAIRHLHHEGSIEFDKDGNIVSCMGFLMDITKRVEAEQVIRQLSLALEQSTESVIITNIDGQIEYVNEACIRITGYSREELIGQNPRLLQSGKTPRETYAAMWQALSQGQAWTGELHNRRKNGGEYFELASMSPIRQPDGRITHYLAVQNDITERKRIEAELDQHRNHLEKLVAQRTAELQASHAELEATLHDLRTTQTQLIQSEKMASLGQVIANVAHEINTPIGAVKSSGANIAGSLDVTLKDLPHLFDALAGADRLLFAQLLNHSRTPAVVLSTREERALIRETAQQLENEGIQEARHKATILVQLHAQTKALEYLSLLRHPESDFILDMAHHIGTLVQSTRNINTAVERVAKIVFALKSFSRMDSSEEMIEADLVEGIETVLTIYSNQIKQGTELVRNYDAIPPLLCFPDELNQVWTNLVHNALQAMNNKGTLTLAVRRIGSEAVVSVGDTGCGIPEAIRSKIFDAFFTTKPIGEGSGLGLDIVKKIVAKHQGRIDLESRVGQGTTFSVYLPYPS